MIFRETHPLSQKRGEQSQDDCLLSPRGPRGTTAAVLSNLQRSWELLELISTGGQGVLLVAKEDQFSAACAQKSAERRQLVKCRGTRERRGPEQDAQQPRILRHLTAQPHGMARYVPEL